MTNLTNIKRDSYWIDPAKAPLIPAPTAGWVPVTDETVHITHASAHCRTQLSSPTGQTLIGVWMMPPVEEPVPYRVQAGGTYKDGTNQPELHPVHFGCGYGTGPSAGSAVVDPFLMSSGRFDKVIMMRPNADTSIPVCFFVGLVGVSADGYANFDINVQRMDKGFDPFSTALF